MKRIYLAGPMRGHVNFNFDLFNATARRLRQEGYEVLNPAENLQVYNEEAGKPFPIERYMQDDLPQVCGVDAVFVLPGWEKSQGARIEVAVARGLNKPVFRVDGTEVPPNILDEAALLTAGDREHDYGHPSKNFGVIAMAFTAHLRAAGALKENATITPRDVGWLMVYTKGLRDAHCEKRDNLVDGVGYLRCIERLEEVR